MKSSNKVKPQLKNDTGSDSKTDYRAKRDDETITDYECRRYGFPSWPGESTYVNKTTALPNSNTGRCETLRLEFHHEQDNDEFCAGIDVYNYYHACTCHRLACVTFFQWNGSEYVQVPLMESDPNTKYLILGQVSELEIAKR